MIHWYLLTFSRCEKLMPHFVKNRTNSRCRGGFGVSDFEVLKVIHARNGPTSDFMYLNFDGEVEVLIEDVLASMAFDSFFDGDSRGG